MAGRKLDAEIDHLYQLPLTEFTAARNVLAKSGGADIRELQKPTLPAWAVNQLYWHERATYEALIAAAEGTRRAHTAVLAGRAGDLRASGKAHEQAVEDALKATLTLLAREGHPATEAARQAILTTLRALPVDEAPGRLTGTLRPGGFEMLAGLTIAGKAAKPIGSASGTPAIRPASRPATGPASKRASKKEDAGDTAARAKARASARAQVEEATRKLKQAEQTARREEFESARAARDAEKAERLAAEARAAFEAAREALEEAEANVPAAIRARDAAARRAQQAAAARDRARDIVQKL